MEAQLVQTVLQELGFVEEMDDVPGYQSLQVWCEVSLQLMGCLME